MKAKDLEVGMCVCVGERRAYVLEIGTKWVWDLHENHEGTSIRSKMVAIAKETGRLDLPMSDRTFHADVVNLSQIVDTWDNHIATEEVRLVIEKERKRQDDFRARFDALGLGEYAQLDANGWVRIPLTDLERLLSKDEHQ